MTTLAEPPADSATLSPSLPPEPPQPDGPATMPFEPRRSVRARTRDEVVGLIASATGSLSLTWVAYERILPWSGWLGFLIVWYATFLAIFALVTSFGNPRPVVVERLVSAVVHAGAALVGFALATTVIFIIINGLPALLHRNFYVHDMAGVGPNASLDQGGIFHALVGTVIQVGIATVIALPLGVGTAVYMTEVGGRLSRTVRTVVEAMTALPDILAGLFVYTVLIIGLGWPRTGFAAAMALTVTMLPIIARSAEVVLRVVPGGLREAGFALGASQFQVVRRVVLPTARAGLATALILGIARIAGETAPLLIVSGASTFTNFNPFVDPMNSLPLFIFSTVRSGQDLAIQRGYGAAALLLFIVVLLFAITRFLARDKVRR